MSFQKTPSLFFLRPQKSGLVMQITHHFQTHKMAIFALFFIANFTGFALLNQRISSQSNLILKQTAAMEKFEAINTKLENTNQQLQLTASQMANSRNPVPTKVLGSITEVRTPEPTSAPATTDTVTISDKPTPLGIIEVNTLHSGPKAVYDTPDKTTQIDTAKPGTVMLFYKKQGGWYQVDPPTKLGQLGWVQQDNVTEMPNVTELPH